MARKTSKDLPFLRDIVKPIPRQIEFLTASRTKRFLLYGGARGPGKSYILRWGLVWRLLEWAKHGKTGVRVGLFSEDYPTLRDRQITKIRTEFPPWLGDLKSTQTDGLGFYVKPEYGSGVLLLRNLDDPGKYIGGEFAGIGVEELTRVARETFDILRGSLRWPGIDDTFFWGATNPLGKHLLWVRDFWIERDFPEEYEALQDQFHYVKALPSDNPHLTPEYWNDLRSQPPHIQKAWIEADWYAVAGSVFEEWREDLHVLDVFKVPPRWRYAAGMDWGMRSRGCFSLFAAGPDGDIVGVDEYSFSQETARDVGRTIGAICQGVGPNPVEYIAADDSMWAEQGTGFPTIAEEVQAGINDVYGKHAFQLAPRLAQAPRKPGSRLTRVSLLHDHLAYTEEEDGTVLPWNRPKLRFTRKCTTAIRTIPVLPYKEKNGVPTEDVDTDADDHTYDAVTYYLMSRPAMPEPDKIPTPPDMHPGFDYEGKRRLEPGEVPHRQGSKYVPTAKESLGW